MLQLWLTDSEDSDAEDSDLADVSDTVHLFTKAPARTLVPGPVLGTFRKRRAALINERHTYEIYMDSPAEPEVRYVLWHADGAWVISHAREVGKKLGILTVKKLSILMV